MSSGRLWPVVVVIQIIELKELFPFVELDGTASFSEFEVQVDGFILGKLHRIRSPFEPEVFPEYIVNIHRIRTCLWKIQHVGAETIG